MNVYLLELLNPFEKKNVFVTTNLTLALVDLADSAAAGRVESNVPCWLLSLQPQFWMPIVSGDKCSFSDFFLKL